MSNSIKDKISKILAKANGTDNEEEAAIFLAKAHEMMEKHQIDLDDLGQDDPMGRYVGLTGTSSSPTWMRHLLNQVAVFYGATTVRTFRGKYFDTNVCGAESARMTTELMYPFIVEQVRAEGRKEAKNMGLPAEAAIRRVANALVHRLAEMNAKERVKNPLARTVSAKNALAIRGTALTQYLESEFGTLRSSKGRGTSTNAVAQAAAGRVSLHRQTGGGSSLRIGSGA
jgi:hypothetical protein